MNFDLALKSYRLQGFLYKAAKIGICGQKVLFKVDK